MVIIKKGPPPERLIAFQRREGATYDSVDFPREDVYTALLKGAGGTLCLLYVSNHCRKHPY